MKKINTVLILIGLTMTSTYAQVGIGTDTPQALLHVAEGSVVFTATGNVPANPGNIPITGGGRRMMWYADKAAFRAGFVHDVQWDQANVGNYSAATGFQTWASGDNSVAMGSQAGAYGSSSIALGSIAHAHGISAIATGYLTNALGNVSTAMGSNTSAGGAISTAMGAFTSAPSSYEVAMGRFNTIYTPTYANTTEWEPTDRLFVVGNGTGFNTRRDALTILKNGNVGIGYSIGSPNFATFKLAVNGKAAKPGGGAWDTASDVRVKKNIEKYSAGLREVLAINPVRFQYNHLSGYADTTQKYVGVLAQEIERILPSTVSVLTNDPLVANKRVYDSSELVYTLINAVKELNWANQELKAQLMKVEAWRQSVSAPLNESDSYKSVSLNKAD